MQLTIAKARDLVQRALSGVGYSPSEVSIIADHLIGCELRGAANGGLSRAISVVERVRAEGGPTRRMRIVRETPVSVLLDGGGDVGYLVGEKATAMAIDRAWATGIGIAGCSNTWYTGMFSHYMENAAQQGFVAFATGSSAWRVAPHGSNEGRFGTNPVAFGFPSDSDPVVADLGTSALMISDATLSARLGRPLADGVAFDVDGEPTNDPLEALKGCIAVWGGHKGSALATCVQLFGLLAGSPVRPDPRNDCAMFLMVLQPDILVPQDQLKQSVTQYSAAVRCARQARVETPIRMPFDRSAEHRRMVLKRGYIEVPDTIVGSLTSLAHAYERSPCQADRQQCQERARDTQG